MWPYRPVTTVFLLAPVVFSFALAMDIYMPVISEMRIVLNTSKEMVQLTLSLFFLVTGFGQLILGPLSDQFGRFKILIISVIIFLVSSFLCATANHVLLLIIYRVFQGIGACGMSVTAFAIVRDAYDGRNSAMVYSFLNAMISISPILGPVFGVFLASFFSWHAIFYFLTGLAMITLILVISFVKESSLEENRKPFDFSVLKRYLMVMRSLTFWAYVLPATSGISAFFTLFSMTPYIVDYLVQPRSQIGFFFGLAGAAYLIGSIISGAVVHRVGVYKTSLIGLLLIICAGILLLTIYWINGLSMWGFFGPSMLATFGCALTSGSGASGAMEPFGNYSGVASAMFGSFQLGGGAIIGSVATLSLLTTVYPLAITMLFTAIISLFFLILLAFFEK